MFDDEEQGILCNITGTCEAPKGARDIASCIYCGKELHEKDGKWWTWDAANHPNPRPQGYVE